MKEVSAAEWFNLAAEEFDLTIAFSRIVICIAARASSPSLFVIIRFPLLLAPNTFPDCSDLLVISIASSEVPCREDDIRCADTVRSLRKACLRTHQPLSVYYLHKRRLLHVGADSPMPGNVTGPVDNWMDRFRHAPSFLLGREEHHQCFSCRPEPRKT